ncbi:hypothetical protein PISMIDRAFT_113057 [Pisolithus microcarpus 441]|uniref:Uncharacterized protein n=1 Tax=Pisolithus microcarpus 441 TaxID=765257 RepID=A0A0C9Z2K2_9AGAM|nr:hypothetical protein PISMIDRAFT_113057 [Pisolithus microcarpus 441]
MDWADTFGFVDPADVLRCCHLIPSFADGRLHPDSVATSCNAHESEDWKVYYINWFVDCDMMMQYHWGLAVGHVYTHSPGMKPNNKDVGVHNTKVQCNDDSDVAPAADKHQSVESGSVLDNHGQCDDPWEHADEEDDFTQDESDSDHISDCSESELDLLQNAMYESDSNSPHGSASPSFYEF